MSIEELIRTIVVEELKRFFDERDACDGASEHMTIAEVSRERKIARGTLRRWIHEGRLPAARVGRTWRLRRADLDKLVKYERRQVARNAELSDAEIDAISARDIG